MRAWTTRSKKSSQSCASRYARQPTPSTQATEVYEMARKLEGLTKDTTIRYATLKLRVEARAAFEQATDLRRELEEMGKELRGEA